MTETIQISRNEAQVESGPVMTSCACDTDRAFLRRLSKPGYCEGASAVRIVDLFAGCGGFSLGVAEAARLRGQSVEVALAIDTDEVALETLKQNLPVIDARNTSVEDAFAREPGARASSDEARLVDDVGPVTVLLGGPPCQGHSNLNNHTRRADPRNALYSRMARAAELLRPPIVLIENVPAILRDRENVLGQTIAWLEGSGYLVGERVIDLTTVGVPQRRRRHVLLALKAEIGVDPLGLLESLTAPCSEHPTRSVRWAIEDLEDVASVGFDSPARVSADNADRIAWLHERGEYNLPNERRPPCHQDDHKYLSMYGRLWWDEPAQTITTGFTSMGQGRFVHPSQPRTLTPHEAARLQTFPDFFTIAATTPLRSAWSRMIGNAVPPFLGRTLGQLALSAALAESARKRAAV